MVLVWTEQQEQEQRVQCPVLNLGRVRLRVRVHHRLLPIASQVRTLCMSNYLLVTTRHPCPYGEALRGVHKTCRCSFGWEMK